MNIQEIIGKKRDGLVLNKEEISYFVSEYTNGNITDYQAAALVMAIYINGMNKEETTTLALEMSKSGDVLDLSEISENVIDKHSTGGVGDKITLVLMPIIASLGIPVAKMSGRGLGFTGGTVDKLESIPGYRTELNINEFIENVKNTGISVIGQTANLTPADKKLYALRDTINCVGSMPLIASSIMSKKIAAGANKIVLDVTVGSGAFMKNKEDAITLSNIMKDIGELADRETVCVLTNMNEPVGNAVGNTLEIIETVECLKGNIPEDIKEIITTIGSYIIKLSGKSEDLEENKKIILENIQNGKAYNKFLELVKSQNGNIEYIENTEKFEKAKYIIPVVADQDGYVEELNAEKVGLISVSLGAGRVKKEDDIDKAVGIILNKKIADEVKVGDVLGFIHANDEQKAKEAVEQLKNTYKISEMKVEKEKIILGVV
ncbi:MAG: thymidine phosphorylase [Clostridia bacterium]|nr:thymidine phosphorylase [Clostridia bacterium]